MRKSKHQIISLGQSTRAAICDQEYNFFDLYIYYQEGYINSYINTIH